MKFYQIFLNNKQIRSDDTQARLTLFMLRELSQSKMIVPLFLTSKFEEIEIELQCRSGRLAVYQYKCNP